MGDVELHETEDGARLMAKLVEINWNIEEALRVRACANDMAALALEVHSGPPVGVAVAMDVPWRF